MVSFKKHTYSLKNGILGYFNTLSSMKIVPLYPIYRVALKKIKTIASILLGKSHPNS